MSIIICFDKNSKRITSISNGDNPVPTYNENNQSICIENCNYIFKKGDMVLLIESEDDENEDYVKIGSNVVKLKTNKYTVITEKNCNKPITLEEI